MMTMEDRVTVPVAWRASALAVACFGGIGIAVGLVESPADTWPNLLLAGFYLLSIALSGALFIAIQHLSGAGWSVVFRRIAEAMMSGLPAAAALMLLVFVFGRQTLYPWAQASADAHLEMTASKAAYLSPPLVFARMSIFMALWIVIARRLRTTS